MQQIMETEVLYEESGFMQQSMGSILSLVVTMGIVIVIYILMGVITGSTYQLTEADIDSISNGTVKGYLKDGMIKGFQGYKQLGTYQPLLVLSLVLGVIILVIMTVAGATGAMGGGYGRGGGAL